MKIQLLTAINPGIRRSRVTCSKASGAHLQVVGQVVLLQGVSLKAVRRRVKVVVANATDETLGLQRKMKSN